MSLSLFLQILAVYGGLLSLVWLLAPKTGLGNAADAKSLFAARALGTGGVTIAIMNWLVSSQNSELMYSFLWPNLLVNAVPIVLALINLYTGAFSRREWAGPITHGIPVVGIVTFLIMG